MHLRKMKSIQNSFILLALLGNTFFCNPNFYGANSNSEPKQRHTLLGPTSQFLFSEYNTNLEDILSPNFQNKFRQTKSSYANFGIKDKELWLKVDFDLKDKREMIFEVASPLLKKIRYFQVCQGKLEVSFISGMDQRNFELPIHPNYQFLVKPNSNVCTFYLSIQSNDSITVPMYLWERDRLQAYDIFRNLLFGVFFGLMISLSLYNFLLYLSIKSRAYLWYVLYTLSFLVFFVGIYGFIPFLFGALFENSISYIIMVASIITSIFALLFANQFLQIKTIEPRLSKLIYMLVISGLLLFIPLSFISVSAGIILSNLFPAVSVLFVIVSIIVSLRSGYKPAIFFGIAWGTLLVSVGVFISENLGLIHGNAFTHYCQVIGASLEAVLLSLALGYRFNDLRAKEAEARELALNKEREALEVERAYARSMQRFVPEQFLKSLDRESILHVQKGDAKSVKMAVLFTDIRGFTALSEKVGTEATFQFLNTYLEKMEPIIVSHGGFIDKFIGDAIMALFTDAENAVLAAKEMANSSQTLLLPDQTVLRTGFGIHYGEVILGTVGSENRLDTTVIGDTVNLASRIESMTKEFSARILVSSEIVVQLSKNKWEWQELPLVQIRGKGKPISLFQLNGY